MRARARRLPAGRRATFESLGFLSAQGGDADEPLVVFDEHDNALVVWTQVRGRARAASRPRSGPRVGASARRRRSRAQSPASSYYEPQVEIDESATVVWTRASDTGELSVQAAFRPKDGASAHRRRSRAPGGVRAARGGRRARQLARGRGPGGRRRPRGVFRIPAAHGGWSAPGRLSTAGARRLPAASRRRRAQQRDRGVDRRRRRRERRAIRTSSRRPCGPRAGASSPRRRSPRDAAPPTSPQVVFDERDNALVAWSRFDGSSTRIETSFRPPDGGFEVSPRRLAAPARTRSSRASRWTRAPRSCGRGPTGPPARAGRVPPKGGSFGAARRCRNRARTHSSPTSPWTSAATPWPSGPATRLRVPGRAVLLPPAHRQLRRAGALSRRPRRPAHSSPRSRPTASATRSRCGPWTRDVTIRPTRPGSRRPLRPPGGQFGLPVRLSDPARNAYQPQVAFENDGDAVVTWTARTATARCACTPRSGRPGTASSRRRCRRTAPTRSTRRCRPDAARSWSGLASTASTRRPRRR